MIKTCPERLRYFDQKFKTFYGLAEKSFHQGEPYAILALAAIGHKDTITSLIAEAQEEGINEGAIMAACPFYFSIK